MKTNTKLCYVFPSVEVRLVEVEGCIAASMILVSPEADNFNRFEWDTQADLASLDIEFLF